MSFYFLFTLFLLLQVNSFGNGGPGGNSGGPGDSSGNGTIVFSLLTKANQTLKDLGTNQLEFGQGI